MEHLGSSACLIAHFLLFYSNFLFLCSKIHSVAYYKLELIVCNATRDETASRFPPTSGARTVHQLNFVWNLTGAKHVGFWFLVGRRGMMP